MPELYNVQVNVETKQRLNSLNCSYFYESLFNLNFFFSFGEGYGGIMLFRNLASIKMTNTDISWYKTEKTSCKAKQT